jgi:hypothetical protein
VLQIEGANQIIARTLPNKEHSRYQAIDKILRSLVTLLNLCYNQTRVVAGPAPCGQAILRIQHIWFINHVHSS